MSLELLVIKYLKICLVANMIVNAICVGSGNKFECVVKNECKYMTCVAWRVGNCQWNSQKIFASKNCAKYCFCLAKNYGELPCAIR